MSREAERTAYDSVSNGDPSRARKVLRRLCGISLGVASTAAAMGVAGAGVAQAQTLTKGDSGPSVAHVQRAVGAHADGAYGSQTQSLVKSFQAKHGLMVDGIAGPQTEGALFGSQTSGSKTGHSSSSHKTGSTGTSSKSSSSTSKGSSSSGGSSLPASIKQCESHGNYHARNSSSGAGGAYQIMPSTWRAYGGSGDPASASPAQQDQIASKIYSSGGASQWTCK